MTTTHKTTYQGEELEYQTYYNKYTFSNIVSLPGFYNTDNTLVEFIETENGWSYTDPMDGETYHAQNWKDLIDFI